jgi:hypothetical protein
MSSWTISYREGSTRFDYSFENIYAPEVMEHFKQCMLAAGFMEDSITTSMEDLIQDLRRHEQNLA